MKKFAVYIRVSTRKQGNSGLGLESQQKICGEFIKAQGGEQVAEFKDVESGTHRDRKGLLAAIDFCKRNDYALVIAKLDRLARDVEFCFKVVNTGIEIHFVDMPQMNTLLLGVFASVAQYERESTSDRTTKALAAKKARGEALGGATDAWRDAYDAKSDEQKHQEGVAKGRTKNARHMESRDVQAFLKVLRNVFPEACVGDVTAWDWDAVNTKEENRCRILAMMRDYKELDSSLFVKWNLDVEDLLERKLQVKLAGYIASLRVSVKTSECFKDTKL
jgi:DNA invertase Pin-like site-specific DNA recombinase